MTARCVGTTGDTFCQPFHKTHSAATSHQHGRDGAGESNFFRDAQFSGEGTTIVAHTEDQCLRTFVLPVDLLEEHNGPHSISAYSTLAPLSTLQSYVLYPGFNLQDPSTTLVLSAAKDLPISLRNALDYDTVHGHYVFENPLQEQYLLSYSLAFSTYGSHFIAGGTNRLAIFDTTRPGESPVSTFKTGYSWKERKFCGKITKSFNGPVSSLNISVDGVLAAGTFGRDIGLYSREGRGECTATWSLVDSKKGHKTNGTGVTSLRWSPSGTYLLVAERQSDVLQVYDIRNTFQRVAELSGREALTPQRLGIDVLPTASGYDVWAGGTDGFVRMWKNPGDNQGLQTPDVEIKVHDGQYIILNCVADKSYKNRPRFECHLAP